MKFAIGNKVRIKATTYKRTFVDGYNIDDVFTIIGYDGSYRPYKLDMQPDLNIQFAANQLIQA